MDKIEKLSYSIYKEIGHGSFGKVYLGKKEGEPGAPLVAIKQMELMKIKQGPIKYLQREIELIQKVTSLHVVRLYDVIQTRTNMYLIYEYCNGGNLRQYLKEKGGRIPEHAVKDIITQLFLGLRTLWQNNIMHRDLKLAIGNKVAVRLEVRIS